VAGTTAVQLQSCARRLAPVANNSRVAIIVAERRAPAPDSLTDGSPDSRFFYVPCVIIHCACVHFMTALTAGRKAVLSFAYQFASLCWLR
jgi:hypothetical protein